MIHCSMNKIKVLAGILLTSMVGIASAKPAEVVVTPLNQPPVIDGQLDDAAWQGGTWYGQFATNSAPPRPATDETQFKIGHDGQFLYLAVRMKYRAGYKPVATVNQRDGGVWKDDSLELMLHVTPTTDEYIHWVINPLGQIYDALRVQGGSLADVAYNSAIQVATRVTDDAWYAELAIPLADLNLSDKTPRTWAINVGRSSRSTGSFEFSSFAQISGDAHQPRQFVPLQIATLDTTPFQWQFNWQPQIQMTQTDNGSAFKTQMLVQNGTSQYDFVELRFRVLGKDGEVGGLKARRGLDAGASRLQEFQIPYSQAGDAAVELEVVNMRTGMTVARRRRNVSLNDAAIALEVTTPAYRNMIFATQPIKNLVGQVRLNVAPSKLDGASVKATLRDEAGSILATETFGVDPNPVEVKLPLPANLKAGLYSFETAVVNKTGEALHETKQAIRKLDPPARGREVRIDGQGVTRVDGKPFLTYGAMMIRPHDDLEVIARQGYTAVFEYSLYWMKPEDQQKWLDRVHSLGLMAIVYPYPEPAMARGKPLTMPLTAEDEAKIRQFVRKWKDHPALLAWYLADEPELHSTLLARLRQINDLCRDEDPYHPTIVLNNTLAGVEDFSDCSDIRMPNPFPGFYENAGPRRRLNYAHQLIHLAASQKDMAKAVWSTPQAFSWADLRENRSDERPPSFAEMRSMNYQAAIAGGTGWIYYSYQHGRRHPSIRLSLGYLAKEVAILKDPLLAVHSARKLNITPKDDRVVHSLRTTSQGMYLFVVNTSDEPIDVQIELPKNAPAKWHVVSEKRSVNLSPSGHLQETIKPFATHIYTTDEASANQLDLQAMQQWVDTAPTLEKELDTLPATEQQKWSKVVTSSTKVSMQ